MRELYGWHERGDHARHGRDAHAPADNAAARALDSPRHAARDALKRKMAADPEARKAEVLRYRTLVDAAYEPKHAAGQLKSQERQPEKAPPEIRDKPADGIAARRDSPESQREERRKPERSWLPRAEMVKAITDIGTVVTTIAVALGDVPAKWEAVAAAGAGAVVSNVIWASKRGKGKHGDRSEG